MLVLALLQRCAADGSVEQFDCVEDAHALAGTFERGAKLQQAARISRGHHVRLQPGDVLCFPVAQFLRGIRLDQVVNSRRAAANRRFGNIQQFQLRDARQYTPGISSARTPFLAWCMLRANIPRGSINTPRTHSWPDPVERV